ncbi:MAG TPA: hypothetical protein DCS29_02270 [Candidatus Magasanikbacteria bacterium]|nr:MAG: hypothetical protein A2479_00590 [Candidatus Magasanikbacteria bacterium RIFOXYC2_FULL_39_8]HAT03582.1 hypothetical protein [Candidatus Magasanikbacteria bacterium]
MVSTRSNGTQPTGQPVRFYKFVALSFLVITIVLLGVVIFMSSKRADITIITRAEPVDATMSVDLGSTNAVVSGFVTSTFVEMTKNFSPEGTKTEEGTAEGVVTLYNDTDVAQPLVATTRLLTSDGVLFRLKSAITVPAQGTIQANVYADKAGTGSDIGPASFTLPGLREDKQTLIYAKSEMTMSGGTRSIGVLSQDDVSKAEKILLEELKKKASEDMTALYPDKGALFEVAQYAFEHDAELGVETSLFNLTGKATVVGVFYDKDKINTYAQGILEKQVVSNSEVLQSVQDAPTAVIANYDMERGQATLTVTHTGFVDIDPNSKELQKIMFFGKTEDEVRRYVMSLNHVQGVEMHFRPLWNRSVPHVASHVNIVVRQVE